MTESKQQMRKRMKEALEQMDQGSYMRNSQAIAETLFNTDEWKKARRIGITISNFPEVDTRKIIEKAWRSGKEVAVPKCNAKTKEMVFRKITNFAQLEIVYFGLFEPIEELTKECRPNDIDLLIVPGLAFTRTGQRLGFGGGYYDRFLPKYRGARLALAFTEQLVPSLEEQLHDIPVGKLILPKGIHLCNAN